MGLGCHNLFSNAKESKSVGAALPLLEAQATFWILAPWEISVLVKLEVKMVQGYLWACTWKIGPATSWDLAMACEWVDNKSVQREECCQRDDWQLVDNLLPVGKLPHMVHGTRAVINWEVNTLTFSMVTCSHSPICCVSISDKPFLVNWN